MFPQQIKVYSTLLGKARAMGFILPDDKAIGVPEGVKYEGATVLEARRGAYFDVVSGLDFASLVRSHPQLCLLRKLFDCSCGCLGGQHCCAGGRDGSRVVCRFRGGRG